MRFIPVLVLAAAIVAGCRIDPPLHLRQAMDVIVKILWKVEVYPDGVKPSGVTLYVFRNGQFYLQHTTADVDSCTLSLEPGRYKLYMITQSPDEYAYMDFNDMTDYDLASVSVSETKSKWYSKASEDEVLINNPEMLAAGVSEEFEITEDMVQVYVSNRTKADPWVNVITIVVPVYPKSVVSQYWITIYSANADVLKSVRASTSGMARRFMLTQDFTGPEEGTQFMTSWTLTMDDEARRVGHLDGRITTFGFPRGELPDPKRDSTLNVAALLVDNQTVANYVFNVGNKIHLEEPVPIGYRYLYRLTFGSVAEPAISPPDVKPPEGDPSGFDAIVEGWEDAEDVDIDM